MRNDTVKFPNFNFSEGFLLAVSMGRVPGFSTVDKFGNNPAIESGSDLQVIWEQGGALLYDADGTAPIQYISSSNDTDNQLISVEGLDINGNFVQQDAQLDGFTVVTLNTPLWRVFRMENLANSTDVSNNLVGIVYCGTSSEREEGVPEDDSTIRAIINNGNNQTLMAVYTIPKGKIGFLYKGEAGVGHEGGAVALANYAHLHYESRRYGKVFKVKKAIDVVVGGSSNFHDIRSFPDIIPAMTDIRICCKYASASYGLWSTFDILLVDEGMFPESYLTAIGQPQ